MAERSAEHRRALRPQRKPTSTGILSYDLTTDGHVREL